MACNTSVRNKTNPNQEKPNKPTKKSESIMGKICLMQDDDDDDFVFRRNMY